MYKHVMEAKYAQYTDDASVMVQYSMSYQYIQEVYKFLLMLAQDFRVRSRSL